MIQMISCLPLRRGPRSPGSASSVVASVAVASRGAAAAAVVAGVPAEREKSVKDE